MILNGLSRSYESTIPMLSHLNATMTFDQLFASVILESHKQEHRNLLQGDEEAVLASFSQKASFHPYGGYQCGRGGCAFALF